MGNILPNCSSGNHLLSVQPKHTSCSCTTRYLPEPPDPFLQSSFPFEQPPACTGAWGCSFALGHVELHEVLVCRCLQPVEVPQDGSTTLSCISHSSHFNAIGEFCPINQIITGDVKQDWTDPWGTVLVTGLHLVSLPLITSLATGTFFSPSEWWNGPLPFSLWQASRRNRL